MPIDCELNSKGFYESGKKRWLLSARKAMGDIE